ncbi:MAG TPA: Calx-beta domain-containing protein, partial [Pyrinomonadaceae bacterium]|nr:Calx-beta domain-containing protein [Pyrinomonadaceae bacterium]
NGPTVNDPTDSDTGPNLLQNFPVLTSVQTSSGYTRIQGSLKSTPNTTFQIDFYSNAALDTPGNGEGALFFSTTSVNTDGNGDVTIDVTIPEVLIAGRVITATATDPNGNTSEFSVGDPTAASGNVQFSLSVFQVIEDVGLATITVVRTGGSAGNLSVNYATADGTATTGQDYTSTSGTLNFGNGETSKTFQIPILNDSTTELDETFTVSLNASNIEVLGSLNTVVITVQDRTTVPVLFLNDALVLEGNPGTTTQALFPVTLSAATGRTVSVNFATANGIATGGALCGDQGTDYESTSGTVTFQPGQFSTVIAVKVCGDSSAEANETFGLSLSNPSNATIDRDLAVGTIIDEDVLELILEEGSFGFIQA